MSKLNIVIQHRLTRDEALTRIKQLLTQIKAQFAGMISNLSENWTGNDGQFSFSVKGFSVSGTLHVRDSEVEIDGNLPAAAFLIKGKIEKEIRNHGERILYSPPRAAQPQNVYVLPSAGASPAPPIQQPAPGTAATPLVGAPASAVSAPASAASASAPLTPDPAAAPMIPQAIPPPVLPCAVATFPRAQPARDEPAIVSPRASIPNQGIGFDPVWLAAFGIVALVGIILGTVAIAL